MSSPTPFEAVLFDAGGVLVVPDPAVMGPVVVQHGGDADIAVLIRAHFAGSFALDEAGPSSEWAVEDWAAYHRGYAAAAGVAESDVDVAAAELRAAMRHQTWRYPFPGAVDALRALHDEGVAIGVVSNAGGQIEQMLVEEGLCQVGEGDAVPVVCVVDSHVVGVAKPDPAIFATALHALGVEAGPAIAYVGDTVFNDVRAAEAAGLTALLHDPYHFHADSHTAHRTLRSLADLIAMTRA